MGCRATKLHMPTRHSPGKVLKFSWEARLTGRAGFWNPILGITLPWTVTEVRQNIWKKRPAEMAEYLSEQMDEKAYSGRLPWRKRFDWLWKNTFRPYRFGLSKRIVEDLTLRKAAWPIFKKAANKQGVARLGGKLAYSVVCINSTQIHTSLALSMLSIFGSVPPFKLKLRPGRKPTPAYIQIRWCWTGATRLKSGRQIVNFQLSDLPCERSLVYGKRRFCVFSTLCWLLRKKRVALNVRVVRYTLK